MCSHFRFFSIVSVLQYSLCIHHRGDYFRIEFARLGEIRSILPPHTRVMALTATASVQLRASIVKTLGMNNLMIISVSPDKHNIKYSVIPFLSIKDSFTPFFHMLLEKRIKMDRMIIFCPTLDECATMYLLIWKELGPHFLHPEDVPDLSRYRLVDMFTAVAKKV